jgi:copper chaperone CopZ
MAADTGAAMQIDWPIFFLEWFHCFPEICLAGCGICCTDHDLQRIETWNFVERIAMQMVLNIEGMSCSHCQARVARALESVSGVEDVDVDLYSGVARIEAAEGTEMDLLIGAVNDAGYRAYGALSEDQES